MSDEGDAKAAAIRQANAAAGEKYGVNVGEDVGLQEFCGAQVNGLALVAGDLFHAYRSCTVAMLANEALALLWSLDAPATAQLAEAVIDARRALDVGENTDEPSARIQDALARLALAEVAHNTPKN